MSVTSQDDDLTWNGQVDAGGRVTESAEQPVVAWYGQVVALPAGAEYDDYLQVLPAGTADIGLTGAGAEIEAQIAGLRGQDTRAHLWGALTCNVPDYGGCQLVVSHVRPDGPGPELEPDLVDGWMGVIYSGPPGPRSGGDDYFVLVGDWNIQYGIDSAIDGNGDQPLVEQLADLRDTRHIVKIWGELVAGRPDWNGTQILVDRIETVDDSSAAAAPPPPHWDESELDTAVYVNEDHNYQLQVPEAATVTEEGVMGFPTEELPEGMTAEAYMEQLREQFGDRLCVHIKYGLGYLTISAPVNEGFRYATCGRTGVGAGELVSKEESVVVGDRTYIAQGFESIGQAGCTSLDCHNETMVVILEDGTRIEYGSQPDSSATYDDYRIKGREMLLRMLASFARIE